MDKTHLLYFSPVRLWIILLIMFGFLYSMVDVYPKEKLIRNEIKSWEQMNFIYKELVVYREQNGIYPTWNNRQVCKLLKEKEEYCFPGEYTSFSWWSTFILWQDLQPLSRSSVDLSNWCTNDNKFYYKTSSGCLSNEVLTKVLVWKQTYAK